MMKDRMKRPEPNGGSDKERQAVEDRLFTPGPWRAVEAPYNPAGWLWVQNGPGALLADVHQNANIPLEIRNANARLMAAAPDLLAALEYYATDRSINGEVARAAVAKALGND